MSLLRDDLRFYTAKIRERRRRRITASLTDYPHDLQTLRRDGILLVNDFISSDLIDSIVDEIRARTDLMTARTSPDIIKKNARYLMVDPQIRIPSTRVFFDSRRINDLARAYLARDAILDRPAVQLKVDVGESSIVEFYHIDDWRYLISAFLLLSDVGPEQAPLVYLIGSHKQRLWRLRKEQEFFSYYAKDSDGTYLNDESPYCGCYLPTDARRLQDRYGYEPVTCTAKAGTLIVFDNLGLHRATRLRSGHRLILSGYWVLPPT